MCCRPTCEALRWDKDARRSNGSEMECRGKSLKAPCVSLFAKTFYNTGNSWKHIVEGLWSALEGHGQNLQLPCYLYGTNKDFLSPSSLSLSSPLLPHPHIEPNQNIYNETGGFFMYPRRTHSCTWDLNKHQPNTTPPFFMDLSQNVTKKK